jgi:uncharacterized membrane protein
MTAATKPLAFTLTSLTVQMATPTSTTMMLNFVSLEYPMLSNKTSNKQETGIILSFAICIIVIIIIVISIKPKCPRPQSMHHHRDSTKNRSVEIEAMQQQGKKS